MYALTRKHLFPIVLTIASAIVGYMLLSQGYESISKIRQIERTPVTDAAAILPGEIKLSGKVAVHKNSLQAPRSKTPVVYYRYSHEVEEQDGDAGRSWRTISREVSMTEFVLLDGNENILIKPDDAVQWHAQLKHQVIEGNNRYSEWWIKPDETIFVVGRAIKDAGEFAVVFDNMSGLTPIISAREEAETRSTLGLRSIYKLWFGIAFISLSVFFLFRVFSWHRLIAYFALLAIVLSMLMIDLGIKMMQRDIDLLMSRFAQQQLSTLEEVSAYAANYGMRIDSIDGIQSFLEHEGIAPEVRRRVESLQLALAKSMAHINISLEQNPESLLTGLWNIEKPSINLQSEALRSAVAHVANNTAYTQLQGTQPLMLCLFSLVFSVVASVAGIRLIKIKRYMENLASIEVSGVAYGMTEINGRISVEDDALLTSPLTQTPCCWYSYKEEERRDGGKKQRWKTLAKNTESITSYCEDDSGRIEIIFDNAEIDTEHSCVEKQGDRRYTEKCLLPGDNVYVIGYAGLNQYHSTRLSMQHPGDKLPYIISTRGEQAIMLDKAKKGMFSINLAFSMTVLSALLASAMMYGFSPMDFLLASLASPLLMIIIMLIVHYNDLVFLRQRVERNSANIAVSMQKRAELIPDVENIVKAYSKYESGILNSLTSLRQSLAEFKDNELNIEKLENDAVQLDVQFKGLVEDYPQLKSNELIASMMQLLSDMENEIVFMRKGYNDAVEVYNTRIQSIPDNILAHLFGFKEKKLIEYGTKQDAR